MTDALELHYAAQLAKIEVEGEGSISLERIILERMDTLIEKINKMSAEIQELNKTFDDYDVEVNEAIEKFLRWNQSKITIASGIYCKVAFTHDEFNHEQYHATITLEKPSDLS